MPEDPIDAAVAEGRTALTEREAKSLVASVGVETPDATVVADPDGAVEAAEVVGFPVVLKVSSPAVTHKSEWGGGAGVALDLGSPDAVREAARRIVDRAAGEGIDAGILVERAHDTGRGTEVIVGGLRDRSFGPVVLAGLGGVFTEIYDDTSHRIAPVDRAEARAALGELTAAPLLEGYRGRDPVDLDALAAVVAAVGDLVDDRESIAEVDLNPVLATPEGAVALDATVHLREEVN